MKQIGVEEVKRAVFQLGKDKAPGPDGFSGLFFQSCWEVVKDRLVPLVRDFFENGSSLDDINCTNIVLIPKVENPEMVGQYRPISLCNFVYKIISRVLVNRMKGILPSIVSSQQRAFVPGRLIQDNVFIAHEAYHYLRNKKQRGRFEVAIKMDMRKAYDRVEWDFLKFVLLKLGFNDIWVSKIMECVCSVKYNLLLESCSVASFVPKRGLRQGDPLSPYLFILVADVLSCMVSEACAQGSLMGVKLARGCPLLSHCFFADDALFFIRANNENCEKMREILDLYCLVSGQEANLDKSGLFFSSNTPQDVRDAVTQILSIGFIGSPGRYLGLPAVWDRSKVAALGFIKEKVCKKLAGWKKNLLSFTEKEVMIKAVVNAIPSHAMSCFKFPKKVCMELDSLISNFWWGQNGDSGKIH